MNDTYESDIDTFEVGKIGPFWSTIHGGMIDGKIEISTMYGEWDVCPPILFPWGTPIQDLREAAKLRCQAMLAEWVAQVTELDTTKRIY